LRLCPFRSPAFFDSIPSVEVIEPFLGGGAILRQKRPAALNIGVDLDSAVIAGFNDATGVTGIPGDARAFSFRAPRRPGVSCLLFLHW
jgi:hypothetical protein